MRAVESYRSARASIIILGLAFLIGPAIAEPLALDVAEATVIYDGRNKEPVLVVRLSEGSQKAFGDFSTSHIGEKIDIRIDGKSVLTPVIREPILGGALHILTSGPDEARQLAAQLSSKTPKIVVEPMR